MAKEVYNASNGANAQEGRVKGSEIFVGGLLRGITERNILEVFSPYGEIVELRMIKDQNGASKGFCFVRFATKEAALRAHNERNGTMVKGKKIGVSLSSDKDSLFFGNLRKDWSSGEFDRLVRQAFTDVVSVDLASTPSLGASSEGRKRLNRGFAFVKFSSHAAAARAHRIGSKPEFLLAGGWHPLVDWVEEKEPKLDLEEMAKVKIAFVGNLPTNADEGLLRKLFEPFGKIEKVVLTRKGHLPFGFVHFENRSCLDNAIREMDGRTVQGPCNGPMSKIQVEVAKTDKEKKRVREEDRSKPFMPGSQTDPLGTSHTHDSLEPKSKAPKFASSVVDAADPYEEAVIALSSTIKERLLQIFRLGIATRFDVDVESITGLKDLPESAAIAVLDQFMISGAEQHDKRAYFNSLVAKHRVKKLGLKWSQPYVHPRNETGFETKESEAISLHAAPRIQATDWSTSGYRASRELLSYTPSHLEDSYTRSSLGKPGDPISSYRTPPLSSLDYGSDTRPASRITSSECPPYQARPLSLFDYGSDARPIPPISSSEHPLERPLERPQMKFDPFTGEPYKFDPFTGKPIRQESHPWRSTNANLI